MKSPKAFRLTEEAIKLLVKLAKKNGLSQTAILELAIREFSRKGD